MTRQNSDKWVSLSRRPAMSCFLLAIRFELISFLFFRPTVCHLVYGLGVIHSNKQRTRFSATTVAAAAATTNVVV